MKHLESEMCRAFYATVMDILKYKINKKGFLIFHIANEGKCKKEQIFKKAQGLMAGVPDYCVIWDDNVAFLEAKAGKNKLTDRQKAFFNILDEFNIEHCVFRTVDEGIEFLQRLGLL